MARNVSPMKEPPTNQPMQLILILERKNKGRCKESTIRGHRKNLSPRWACTPLQYFCILLGTNKVVVVVVDDDALVRVEL